MSKDKFICESAKSRVNSNSSNAVDACDSANIPVSDACDVSASASVTKDAYDNPEMVNKIAIRALILLLISYVFGTLCLQGFNLLFKQVGTDVSSPEQASLITGLPGIVLGIACFIYGSLGDFVSLRKTCYSWTVYFIYWFSIRFLSEFLLYSSFVERYFSAYDSICWRTSSWFCVSSNCVEIFT